MAKRFLFLYVALFYFCHSAHAAKLILKNDADYDVTVYPDFEWTTVTVTKGEREVVFDKKRSTLTMLTAFNKNDTSRTVKKYKLKQSLIDQFNRIQKEESQGKEPKELNVNFPQDFHIEVSLRLHSSRRQGF